MIADPEVKEGEGGGGGRVWRKSARTQVRGQSHARIYSASSWRDKRTFANRDMHNAHQLTNARTHTCYYTSTRASSCIYEHTRAHTHKHEGILAECSEQMFAEDHKRSDIHANQDT